MKIVAEMYADNPLRCYEVAEDCGHLYSREQGTRKWTIIHKGLNPDLATYLARCEANFGWKVQVF